MSEKRSNEIRNIREEHDALVDVSRCRRLSLHAQLDHVWAQYATRVEQAQAEADLFVRSHKIEQAWTEYCYQWRRLTDALQTNYAEYQAACQPLHQRMAACIEGEEQ
jgi:hypothetical protein